MIEQNYENLKNNENLRESLSLLRSEVKDPVKKEKFLHLVGDGSVLTDLLKAEDAKVRKNAALFLGDLRIQSAVDALVEAYRKEPTLFVKSSYLSALGKLDASAYQDFFLDCYRELQEKEVPEEEKKHVGEELRELCGILSSLGAIKKHSFVGFEKPHKMLLATNRGQQDVTLGEISEISATVQRKTEKHPLGVLVLSKDVIPFTKLRTYRELLFPIEVEGRIEKKPEAAAEILWKSGLYDFLQECHKGSGTFFFRLEVKGSEAQTEFVKKLANALERISGWKLMNSTGNYEMEIRLIQTKEGGYVPFLKLFTLPMKRFSYRRNAIAMSIHPATAAMLMHLAKPYLKEGAQVLDPCCGVGTMLIERDICVPAGDMYGIDIFGDAIEMGRENASLAGEKINFIHRDFMDFKHNYPFDEIVVNMPVKGKKTKEEMDAFYQAFFKKAGTVLKPGGILIMYSNEIGFVKKQLRLQQKYRLIQEFTIREKDGTYLFIIEMKG